MSSSSQSQQTPAKASDSKYPSNQQQQRQQPVVPSARPYSSLLLPVSATMPNALHDFSSTIGSPNRYSSIPDWSSHTQTQHSRYPYPLSNSAQQFLPHSYSGQSTLPPSFPGQGDLMPSSHIGREQAVAYLDKFSSPDAFASPSFDPLTRAAYPQAQSTRLQHQQLQLAQLMGLQQQQQQMQPQFPSPRYSQMPQSFPPTQSAGDSASRLLDDFEQLRRPTRSSREADAFLSRDQDPFSIGAQMGLSGYPMAHSSLNTSIPSDPRAPTIATSTHTVSYSAYPTAQGVMSSQDIAFALMLGGARPTNPAHEWLTDNTAPPGIAVNQGPFITSLDTKVPLPASPAGTASSASLASPATANTSISSSFDGFEAPPAGPMAVRTASGASGTPLSSPSTSSPNTSPKTSSSVAGGKRGREESLQSLSQSDPEVESRHFLSPQKPQSLGSRSGPVSPSVSSSVARVPTPSSALTQSFTTISLSSVAPSDAPSDPSSYLFQRPSPSAGLSSSSSTASLPECVSVSSLIFNRSNLSSSSRLGSSAQLPINLDTPTDGSNSPSKRVKPGPSPSSISSGLSLPSSATFLASGVPSLTWPAQSPLSQRTAPSPSSGSAYPFNAVPTNRPSKKAGKAEPKGPKNPRSAYVYFVADQRKKLARTETLANSTFQEVASALGARWRALGPEERRPFEEMARRDKERYQTEKSRSFDDM